MKVTEFADPRPHIIIEDVFSKKQVKEMLDECVTLGPKFAPGKMFMHKTKKLELSKKKKAFDVHIDKLYKDRSKSAILTNLNNFCWGKKMNKICVSSQFPIFDLLSYTKSDNTHVIRYA